VIIQREHRRRVDLAHDPGEIRGRPGRVPLGRRDVDDPDGLAAGQRRPAAAPGERVDLEPVIREGPCRLDRRQRVREPGQNPLAHRSALTPFPGR